MKVKNVKTNQSEEREKVLKISNGQIYKNSEKISKISSDKTKRHMSDVKNIQNDKKINSQKVENLKTPNNNKSQESHKSEMFQHLEIK